VRVLVTGGAGFVGPHLVRLLLARGDDVIVLDDLSTGRRENVPKGARLIVGDVADYDTAREAMTGCDEVYHLAAVASVPACAADPWRARRTNERGTAAVCFEAPGGAGVLIMSSAAAAVPASVYGRTKAYAERIGLSTGCAVVRPENIYGPGRPDKGGDGGVVAAFVGAAVEGRAPVIHGDGSQSRDFIHVEDVCAFLMSAIVEPGLHAIGTGTATSIAGLWDIIREEATAADLPDPGEPAFGPSRPGDIAVSRCAVETPHRWTLREGVRALIADRVK